MKAIPHNVRIPLKIKRLSALMERYVVGRVT